MSVRTGTLDGDTYQWFDRHPRNLLAACDKCHRRVYPNEPRLQVHDNKGRFESKGSFSSYWCTDCSLKRGLRPPVVVEEVDGQERMDFG